MTTIPISLTTFRCSTSHSIYCSVAGSEMGRRVDSGTDFLSVSSSEDVVASGSEDYVDD